MSRQRFHFSVQDDIALLNHVLQENPLTATSHRKSELAWARVAESLRALDLQVEARTVKNRFKLLHKKFVTNDEYGLRLGASEEDFQTKYSLLAQLAEVVNQMSGESKANMDLGGDVSGSEGRPRKRALFEEEEDDGADEWIVSSDKRPRETLLHVLQSLERQREESLANEAARMQFEKEKEIRETAANAARDEQLKQILDLLHELAGKKKK